MKFLRRIWSRHSKLGKGRKKKQIWRKPKGRDNKMREKRKGYPVVVSKGYKKDKKVRGEIEGKKPIVIYNLKGFEKAGRGNAIIFGRIGRKKKTELAKKAKEMKIGVHNLNVNKFLKGIKKKEDKRFGKSVQEENKK